jgi:L-lactate utilization protein LutB
MHKLNIEKLIRNFEKRNISASYFKDLKEVKSKIFKMISKGSLIGIGNSRTLKKMKLSKDLTKKGYRVLDKTLAKSKEESVELKRRALLTDFYITGTNAISSEGHIVNIDHSGNRVAAMIYGPKKVIVVIGINKITETLDQAIDRAKNIAAPLNAKRAGLNPPCVKRNECIDCSSDERICNSMVIIEGQRRKDRIKVIIVDEELGF